MPPEPHDFWSGTQGGMASWQHCPRLQQVDASIFQFASSPASQQFTLPQNHLQSNQSITSFRHVKPSRRSAAVDQTCARIQSYQFTDQGCQMGTLVPIKGTIDFFGCPKKGHLRCRPKFGAQFSKFLGERGAPK